MDLIKTLGILCLFACSPLTRSNDAPGPAFDPPLFVFQNGVDFGTFEQEAKVLAELGYEGLGSVKPPGLAERIKAYDTAGLRIFSIYVALSDERLDACIELLRGTEAVVELTVRKPKNQETVDEIRRVCDLAADAGLRVALYPHANFTVEYIADAQYFIEAVGSPSLGLMFNLCHFLKGEHAEDLEATLQEVGPHLFAASTCGADREGTDWSQLIRPLDEGTFDQARLLRALKDCGFSGAIGLQCYAVKGDKRENLRRSRAAWTRLRGNLGG